MIAQITTAEFQQTLNQARSVLTDVVIRYGLQFIGALMIMSAGYILSRYIGRMLNESLEKHTLEPPVRLLMVRAARLMVLALTLVIALDQFGVPIGTLIAGIGVAGLGVGLALQGVLTNLLAGLVIIITRPFRVGEYIDILGEHGTVATIELLSTTLSHPDRSRVIIPNRKILGEILHNYGTIRQLDLKVGVAYSSDIRKAVELIRSVLSSNPLVLKDYEPYIGITELADSSINLSVKPWTKITDFGAARVQLYQEIVDAFRAADVQIPFPQREIRVLNPPQDRIAS